MAGKGKRMATGLLGAGLGFINGMNAAYTHANKADRDKFPQWFRDMKGWGDAKPAQPAIMQPQQNVTELEDSNRALQSSYDREWESLNQAEPSPADIPQAQPIDLEMADQIEFGG